MAIKGLRNFFNFCGIAIFAVNSSKRSKILERLPLRFSLFLSLDRRLFFSDPDSLRGIISCWNFESCFGFVKFILYFDYMEFDITSSSCRIRDMLPQTMTLGETSKTPLRSSTIEAILGIIKSSLILGLSSSRLKGIPLKILA